MDAHAKDGLKGKNYCNSQVHKLYIEISCIYIYTCDATYFWIENGIFSISTGQLTVAQLDLVNLYDSKHRVLS